MKPKSKARVCIYIEGERTSFCLLRPFLDWPSPVKSSCIASTAMFPPLSRWKPPSTSPDNSAMGDISVALRNGMGTVLPAAYMDQSYNQQQYTLNKQASKLTAAK